GPDYQPFCESGRRDSNSGPLVPQTSALTRLRHAPRGTPRYQRVRRPGAARLRGQASIRPGRGRSARRAHFLGQALVQTVDELGHRLELLGDDADAVLAEVLGLDLERVGDARDDVVRWHRTVPVDDVIQVAGGEIRLVSETPVRRPGLDHQALDRRAERILAVSGPSCHQTSIAHFTTSHTATRPSSLPSRPLPST